MDNSPPWGNASPERATSSGTRRTAADCCSCCPTADSERSPGRKDLAAIIADRVRLRRRKDGNDKGDSIPTAHLNAMLQSNAFLGKFAPLDHVARTPLYLPGFALTKPGYNDGGDGYRVFYAERNPRSPVRRIRSVVFWTRWSGNRTPTVPTPRRQR